MRRERPGRQQRKGENIFLKLKKKRMKIEKKTKSKDERIESGVP